MPDSRIEVQFHLDELDKAANERITHLIQKAVEEELEKNPTTQAIGQRILLGIREVPPTSLQG